MLLSTHMESLSALLPPSSVTNGPLEFVNAAPGLYLSQHHIMFVVPLWQFLMGGVDFPNPFPTHSLFSVPLCTSLSPHYCAKCYEQHVLICPATSSKKSMTRFNVKILWPSPHEVQNAFSMVSFLSSTHLSHFDWKIPFRNSGNSHP